jgi:phage shock protein A
MSIWDSIKDVGKGILDTITGKGDRDQKKLLNQQMKDYQEQSRITKEELAKARGAEVAEKRRIQEKQIRSLRGKASSRGFLGSSNAESGNQGLGTQLGG